MESLKKKLITPRDKINKNPAKVGKAVYDILSKEQLPQTVEETISAMTDKYFQKLMEAVNAGCSEKDYPEIFYIVVERKKETLGGNAHNVLGQRFFTCPFRPRASLLREERPNSDFDLYEINKTTNEVTLVYTILTKQDSKTILKNPHLYDPQLVKWLTDFENGVLDRSAS